MKVSEVMTGDVRCCGAEEPLGHAARIMWERDCGSVPVIDAERTVRGMITDRDIAMAAYTQGCKLDELPIHRVMARNVSCCRANEEIESALQTMSRHQLRRLPVVDRDAHLVGMLSLADAIQAVSHSSGPRKIGYTVLETLLEVTRPRTAQAAAAASAEGAKPKGNKTRVAQARA